MILIGNIFKILKNREIFITDSGFNQVKKGFFAILNVKIIYRQVKNIAFRYKEIFIGNRRKGIHIFKKVHILLDKSINAQTTSLDLMAI